MPPTAHHFTPVYPLHEPQHSFRSKQYAPPPRKRKRQQGNDDESDDSDTNVEPLEPVQSHDINDPYRVAGWPENIPLPGSSFPHAPAVKPKSRQLLSTNLQKELAGLKPPLYIPPPSEQDTTSSLRRHHLSVLTTILHTSLLKHDFVRAGRAWGMILRTDIMGRPLDVRTHGRWGVGAEILMRKFSRANNTNTNEQLDNNPIISDEGFEAAKDYYERLILQFPYQKTNPNAISSLTFYPAMFGLCIYEIQQSCKSAHERIRTSSPDMENSDSELSLDRRHQEEEASAIRRSELASAASLAARMDELMLSPPFDTYPPLLQLRGSVALWLADLFIATAEPDDDNDENKERASMERARARRCVDRIKAAGIAAPGVFMDISD